MTLAAVRLVNRAARDEFVDGRCTRVTPLWEDAPLSALAGAAPRLRSIVSLQTRTVLSGTPVMDFSDCEALADVFDALPERGRAALRELRLGYVNGEKHCLKRLAAAARRLHALTRLEFSAGADSGGDVAPLLLAVSGAMPALARAHISYACEEFLGDPDPAPVARPAVERLEALTLAENAAAALLPAMLGGAGRAAWPLVRLKDLDFTLSGNHDWPQLLPAPWRTPWLSQLTRLRVSAYADTLPHVARALAPRSLPALRTLQVDAGDAGSSAAGLLRALLAACDAAALESLDLYGVPCAAVRDAAIAAPGLPALRSLALGGLELCDDDAGPAPVWQALLDAPLAPLTCLDITFEEAPFNGTGASGLAPLLACGWARGLRALSLVVLHGDYARRHGRSVLRELTALEALPDLHSLKLSLDDLNAATVREAAATARVWAPRLAEFELTLRCPYEGAATVAALRALLLRVPFSGRLERIGLDLDCIVTEDELQSLSAACARALPWLARFDFRAAQQSEDDEARAEIDDLMALHWRLMGYRPD